MDQRAKAKRFLELHTSGRLLVLPNAWDAGSARIFEHAGFQALGTTSAGVALSLGYPDGERVSRAEMLEAVRRTASAVAIPVTADLEAGYGRAVNDAVETARGAIAAGAVGMNFEDSTSDDRLVDVVAQVERIRAIKKLAVPALEPVRTSAAISENIAIVRRMDLPKIVSTIKTERRIGRRLIVNRCLKLLTKWTTAQSKHRPAKVAKEFRLTKVLVRAD